MISKDKLIRTLNSISDDEFIDIMNDVAAKKGLGFEVDFVGSEEPIGAVAEDDKEVIDDTCHCEECEPVKEEKKFTVMEVPAMGDGDEINFIPDNDIIKKAYLKRVVTGDGTMLTDINDMLNRDLEDTFDRTKEMVKFIKDEEELEYEKTLPPMLKNDLLNMRMNNESVAHTAARIENPEERYNFLLDYLTCANARLIGASMVDNMDVAMQLINYHEIDCKECNLPEIKDREIPEFVIKEIQ